MLWCCCQAVSVFEFDADAVGTGIAILWWESLAGELDPIEYRAFSLGPSFQYGSADRRMMPFGIGGNFGANTYPIPVRTYTEIMCRWYGLAVNFNNTPRTPDVPQDYDIYVWDQTADFATALINGLAGNGGIPRSELIGPVTWNASALDWADPGLLVDLPNLASICNPVINGPGWNADSCLFLIFDTADQDVGDTTPEGRTLSPNPSGASVTFRW